MDKWEQELLSRVKAAGFADLDQFLSARPGVSHPALAEELGGPVMGVQIVTRQLNQAKARGTLRDALADALVRCLRQVLTQGWSKTPGDGVEPDFVNVTGWSTWSALVTDYLPDPEIKHAVWNVLNTQAKPGWLPETAKDPLIVEAFRSAWPITS